MAKVQTELSARALLERGFRHAADVPEDRVYSEMQKYHGMCIAVAGPPENDEPGYRGMYVMPAD